MYDVIWHFLVMAQGSETWLLFLLRRKIDGRKSNLYIKFSGHLGLINVSQRRVSRHLTCSSNGIRTLNDLVRKRTLNHLAKVTK